MIRPRREFLKTAAATAPAATLPARALKRFLIAINEVLTRKGSLVMTTSSVRLLRPMQWRFLALRLGFASLSGCALAATSLVAAGAGAAGAPQAMHARSALPEDTFTPVVVQPLGTRHVAVPGTDGLVHVVYELELSNTKPAAATLQRIDVLDADHPSRVLASYAGSSLIASLRTLKPTPADSAVIPFGSSRLFYVELAFKPDAVPRAITQRFRLLGAANPGPATPATPLEYVAGRIDISRAPLPVLAPPLRGAGWVAINGCCNSGIVHRGSFQGIDGSLYDAQRFAIDWMRVNAKGEFVQGDPADVNHYVDYATEVHAVADGTVVDVLDDLPDQVPGKLPDPTRITLRTVDGNHVTIDMGHGLYVFYAHLKKGTVRVKLGDHVTVGEVIADLGNSGNTSAPHLHIHVMDSPSALASDGLPYVIDRFDLAGQVDIQAFDKSDVLTGQWGKRFAKPTAEKDRFPLNLNIVDFPAR